MSSSDLSKPDVMVRTAEQTQELVGTFVTLADTLVADFDIVELLELLNNSCVTLLGITASALLIDDQKGHLVVLASSSEESRLMEAIQLQNDEGPCLECVRTGVSVYSDDLTADLERWPQFARVALDAGFSSVVSLPLRLRDQTIGGLNLFQAGPTPISDRDRAIAQGLAAVATIGILHQRTIHRSELLAEQLQTALTSRILIEQAKGVISEREGIDVSEAFELLRQTSRNTNTKLTDVARQVVEGVPGVSLT
jgi:GAF domain-containing protein